LRVALIADIHGNSVALDAVLDAIARDGVDAYWLLGDLVAMGPDPAGVLERIDALPNTSCIRGNTDRYTTTGDRPGPSKDAAIADPSILDVWAEVEKTFAWTQGAITAAGRFEWIESLPLDVRYVLDDGTRVLGVHASPGRDDGDGAHPKHTDAELEGRFAGGEADLVVVGHTHTLVDRTVAGVRIVNPGSVSNPPPGEHQARYAILGWTPDGYDITFEAVDYDRSAVVEQLERIRHPGRRYLQQAFT
jgi:predicted phosphodiesterase